MPRRARITVEDGNSLSEAMTYDYVTDGINQQLREGRYFREGGVYGS